MKVNFYINNRIYTGATLDILPKKGDKISVEGEKYIIESITSDINIQNRVAREIYNIFLKINNPYYDDGGEPYGL